MTRKAWPARVLATLSLLPLLTTAGCSEPTGLPPGEVTRVEISSSGSMILLGDTVRLEARLYDRRGEEVENADFRWGRAGPDPSERNTSLFPMGTNRDYVRLRAKRVGTSWWRVRSGDLVDSVRIEVGHHEGVRLRPEVFSSSGAACGIDGEGRGWCWGTQRHVDLDAGAGNAYGPTPLPDSLELTSIAGGSQGLCALTEQGETVCWSTETLGLGNGAESLEGWGVGPVQVVGGKRFVSISVGGSTSSCGLTAEGEVYCWGWDYDGLTGNREPAAYCPLSGAELPCAPAPVRAAAEMRFRQVAVGGGTVCGIDLERKVWCWGRDRYGQLGRLPEANCDQPWGNPRPCSREPLAVPGVADAVEVSLGFDFACALTEKGSAYCWGHNGSQELGAGIEGDPIGPVRVAGGHVFRSISAGNEHACALTDDGTAWCWGSARWGQTGDEGVSCLHGAMSIRCNPVPVSVHGDLRFQQLAAGRRHTCGVTQDGRHYCWGSNDGQLGIGDHSVEWTHVPMPVIGVEAG